MPPPRCREKSVNFCNIETCHSYHKQLKKKMDPDVEVKNAIYELRSGCGSSLHSALIIILINSENSLTQLIQMGAGKLLIQVLADKHRHGSQTDITDIVMSILANICLEKAVREQVVSCDGLTVIACVTLTAEEESIQISGVCALGYLALDVDNREKIFNLKIPAFVVKRLMESKDADFQSIYCAALHFFGPTENDARRLMKHTHAIQALAALLKLDNRKLALKSLRIMSNFSKLCCSGFADQIREAKILKTLVTLADDKDDSFVFCSLSIIFRLCGQEIIRPDLGSAGVISLFVSLLEEANIDKIQEAGGLELFISILNINEPSLFSDCQLSVLYNKIIRSLVNFVDDYECLIKLLKLGLVRILLEHLKRLCAFTLVNDDLRKEIHSFAQSLEANSADRGKHLERDSKTDTAGMERNNNHKSDSVALDKNSASCSLTGTVSSMSQMTRSPVASVLPDSPYRSPYLEPAHYILTSQDITIHSEINTTKTVLGSNSVDLVSCTSSPDNSLKVSNIDGSTREGSPSTKIDTTAARSDQSNDVRVKKKCRFTEKNILIILGRVSVTTTLESTAISCLLRYIASASNPLQRSCRILYRMFNNSLYFETLILMHIPALIVKTLVLEEDGTFPHKLFCSDNRSITKCCGSQTSLRSIFQNGHYLIVDDKDIRGDIYEAGCSRAESRVRIGLELLHTLRVVAMSRFGEGEILHILLRHSPQRKLACVISMLHLQIGWCHASRDKFFTQYRYWKKILSCVLTPEAPLVRETTLAATSLNVHPGNTSKLMQSVSKLPVYPNLQSTASCDKCSTKYSLWETILPCLFTSEAPLVRESIVAAISLNVHLCNPSKLTQPVSNLVCPDLQSTAGYGKFISKPFHEHANCKPNSKPSLRNSEGTKIYASSVGSKRLKKISEEFVADGLQVDEHTAGCVSDTATFCPYRNKSHKHDVCFLITDENNSLHKIRAHRQTLVEKSEVFAGMFSGSYVESTQSEINMQDVSRDAFEFTIHYLHGCSTNCPVIASLSMAYVKSEIVTAEVCVTPDSTESNSSLQQNDKIVCDKEKNIEERNSAGKKEYPCVLNDISRSILEVGRKHCEVASAERSVRTDTTTNISQVLECTQSQDSLDSLTLEDRLVGGETSHACQKLHFKNPRTGNGNEDTEVHVASQSSGELTGITRKCLEELINRCESILALANKFLLHDLMCYPAAVLSHVCLRDHTIEDIFHLACFYHLDYLAFDCIRETLMSGLPCRDAAAIYVQLAEDGYREQVHTALTWLASHVKSD